MDAYIASFVSVAFAHTLVRGFIGMEVESLS